MIQWLKRIWKQYNCKHEYKFIRNIHGDEINYCNGYRSVWICQKCGKIHYSTDLHLSLKQQLFKFYDQYYENLWNNWKNNNKSTLNRIYNQMIQSAKNGECGMIVQIICDTSKSDMENYKHWFNDHDIEVVDIDLVSNINENLQSRAFHIRWAV